MSMTLMNINPQKEISHHYDFPVYTASKYRDPKLDTYRRITHKLIFRILQGVIDMEYMHYYVTQTCPPSGFGQINSGSLNRVSLI